VRRPARSSRQGIPYPDIRVFRDASRRTTLVRVALAVALVGATLLEVGLARGGAVTETSYLEPGATNVVVMDFSYSITGSSYRLIVNGLRKIEAAGDPIALIGFSDVAYEMLPPGTPARELEPVTRLFVPLPVNKGPVAFPPSPWSELQGGTRISRGLELADEVLRRDGVRNASVVLLSDLETSSEDNGPVVDAVSQLKAHGYSLHLIPLDATQTSLQFFRTFVDESAFVDPHSLSGRVQRVGSTGVLSGQTPWWFLLCAALIALLLAANERTSAQLELAGLQRRTR
jgi:hypothetical protein